MTILYRDYTVISETMMTRTGFEPVIPPWKGGVLTTWPTGQLDGGEGGIWTLAPISRPTPLAGAPLHHLSTSPFNGSTGRIRTYDRSVNSRLLYHWATVEYSKAFMSRNLWKYDNVIYNNLYFNSCQHWTLKIINYFMLLKNHGLVLPPVY